MVQELTFTKNGRNRWESSFVSTGSPSAVQIKVDLNVYSGTSVDVIVYGNLPEMERVILATLGRPSQEQYYLFEVDVPEGVEVTVESLNEPVEGKVTTE
ncbi:MAG: hypothetical protein K2H16_06065 [Prevotella sp.]|nr:hypothetical protein [Prevotella sp.]